MEKTIAITVITAFVLVFSSIKIAETCNEMVCASIVSKCMLTQSCRCDLKDCSCCKDCLNCLSYLYSECCSCVDLCPKPNETRNALSQKSHIEEFEGVPGLFDALTADPDEDKWHTVKFPVDFDALLAGPKLEKDVNYYLKQDLDESSLSLGSSSSKEREHTVTVNCTVVYLKQCLSLNKCKQNCESMGASSARWFHDGCCECVGSTCIHFGINESRCTNCPEYKDDLYDPEDGFPDNIDFGESIGPLDDNKF